jgi:hypothetical protein
MDPGHAKIDGVCANLGSKEAGVELLVDNSYLQFGGKDMVSEKAILIARKSVKGLGLGDKAKQKAMVLCE